MRDRVNRVEIDQLHNTWYLSSLFGNKGKWKATYDMTTIADKADALTNCTPLYMVADKLGSMMGRGVPYILDKDGNEYARFDELKNFLKNPNPFQTFTSFFKEVEISLKVFGYCPIVLVRGFKSALPKAMWVVPCEYFHLKGSGSIFNQFDKENIISEAYIEYNGKKTLLEDYEYIVIHNGKVRFGGDKEEITFASVTDSLSQPISNWVASMSASHTLIVNGGPKGILYNDYTDPMGNVALTADDEKKLKDKFKETYGLVGKEYPILVSRHKLNWIPLDFNAGQLQLHEEDARCTEKICNAIGLNPNLFTDAKYDNQESAKKSAYQDVIIPDSKNIADALTKALCPEGVFISIDFADVECLQPDRNRGAETLSKLATALSGLIAIGVISPYEARKETSKYIDIDPDKVEV